MKTIKKIITGLLIFFFVGSIVISALFGYRDKSVEELKDKYAQVPCFFVSIEGMNVHYRDEGDPSDSIPLVLIHGTGSSLQTYDVWADSLKMSRRVIRLDMPAFGLTGPFLNRDYTIEHYVSFLQTFLDTLQVKQCILVGNSLGGQIAWQFTISHPERVNKLVLIDAAGYPLNSISKPIAFTLAQKPIVNRLMTFITPKFLAKKSLENVYADKSKVTDSLVDRYFDMTLRKGNRQALVDRMTTIYDTTRLPLIHNIQQMTLVLWGDKDELIPLSNAERFHNDLPNDTLIILPNVGHVPMEESPQASLAALLAFLKA